jgi:hypothetical protein
MGAHRVYQGPSITKKMTCLFWYASYAKSIQFINKPVFLFSFFPCCCFAFISKQQQQKNHHFIYDLSMLYLGLGVYRASNSSWTVKKIISPIEYRHLSSLYENFGLSWLWIFFMCLYFQWKKCLPTRVGEGAVFCRFL